MLSGRGDAPRTMRRYLFQNVVLPNFSTAERFLDSFVN